MASSNRGEPSAPRTDSELSEFLLRACHDLRGPLRAIRTHAELLLKQGDGLPDSDFARSLGFVVNGSMQAVTLIDGLTEYSLALQIEPASFQLVPTGVMLRAALAKLAPFLRENNAEVTHDGLPTVPGDADRLMQLFVYLIDHSVRHRGSEDPRISIGAESRGEEWLFRVHNNGTPVEADLLEKMFQPFERLHVKDRPGPGLATCRAIVERHGGAMWAESAPGAGNTFCFTLPE